MYMNMVEWMLGRVGERRMDKVKKTEKDEEREREIEKRQIFPFVPIWQPFSILMTGQSRWFSRVENSTIPLTALFSSSAQFFSSMCTILFIISPMVWVIILFSCVQLMDPNIQPTQPPPPTLNIILLMPTHKLQYHQHHQHAHMFHITVSAGSDMCQSTNTTHHFKYNWRYFKSITIILQKNAQSRKVQRQSVSLLPFT